MGCGSDTLSSEWEFKSDDLADKGLNPRVLVNKMT